MDGHGASLKHTSLLITQLKLFEDSNTPHVAMKRGKKGAAADEDEYEYEDEESEEEGAPAARQAPMDDDDDDSEEMESEDDASDDLQYAVHCESKLQTILQCVTLWKRPLVCFEWNIFRDCIVNLYIFS